MTWGRVLFVLYIVSLIAVAVFGSIVIWRTM